MKLTYRDDHMVEVQLYPGKTVYVLCAREAWHLAELIAASVPPVTELPCDVCERPHAGCGNACDGWGMG